MKKIVPFLTLLLLTSLGLQSQSRYAIDSTSVWTQEEEWYAELYSWSLYHVSLKARGDTIIDDKLYYPILMTGWEDWWSHGYGSGTDYIYDKYRGGVREDSGFVYYLEPESYTSAYIPEYAIYNYNYLVGDTIETYIGNGLIITSIDTLEDGRKQFNTDDPDFYIIEGVGANTGFIELEGVNSYQLRIYGLLGCYIQQDSIKFMFDQGICNYVYVDIPESEKKTAVYPNPATHFLMIDADEPVYSCEIFDLNGIKQSVSFTELEKIDISSLRPGLYLLRINHQKGILFVKNSD